MLIRFLDDFHLKDANFALNLNRCSCPPSPIEGGRKSSVGRPVLLLSIPLNVVAWHMAML